MTRSRCAPRPAVRLALQPLEGRLAPANLTVTFSAVTHVLTVVGDNEPNDLTVQGDPNDPTRFTLSSSGTINGVAGPSTPSGVHGMTIRLLAGNDQVTFGNADPVRLKGGLSVHGGDGDNTVIATDLAVGKGFAITNGLGADTIGLTNLSVRGSLTVRNGDGGSDLTVDRNSAGVSTVGGSVLVTNGAGRDSTTLNDLNVGGGVAVRNGRASPSGEAGLTQIRNAVNTAFRSQIRGSVSVSYLDGTGFGADILGDVEVGGDVTFANGVRQSLTIFDGVGTALPTVVRGNLTVTGTGANNVGLGGSLANSGLVVGKSLRVATGAGADSVTMKKTEVRGATTLRLGDGANAVTIDDSLFAGAFALTTGAGVDTIGLDATAGTAAATTFQKAVTIAEGAGIDSLTLAGAADPNQALVFLSTFVVRPGAQADALIESPSQMYFPFGTAFQYIV